MRMHRIILSSVACLTTIFFHIISQMAKYSGSRGCGHKICVFISSTISVWNISHSRKNSAGYYHLLYHVFIAVLALDAGLLARSQYPEGPATDHLDTGFSWFPCVYKPMLRWFPSFQVATTCFSCSPPDLNFLVTFFSYFCTCKITTATGWQPNCTWWWWWWW